ncbi:MAG TPA: glutamate--tRNA ligase [Rectinemataceae bacterium]|nr:glutamate--tRNA ligase [Rectinemataceae bacterium]
MEVRVRYAPSPTGLQHIGSVRTALFNYLFAKSAGGKFILRLEDTDRTRSSERYVQNLYDTFRWLGFYWDEGPDIGGPSGPYVQSERFETYRRYAEELVAKGRAYRCFCSEERVSKMHSDTNSEEGEGGSYGYDRACRDIDPDLAADRVRAGETNVIRLKIPLEGTTTLHDLLLGEVQFRNADVNPDPVLLKSDGYPTYHLANVVDDHLMGISHVLRAQEWLPSAPLHLIMYEAFGWEPPAICHLPMVLGEDGHKLSKRHGATALNEFRDKGYLREALINYVAMLGASYEEGRDLFSLDDLGRLFRLEKINKAPAIFDYQKLEWFNGQYIRLKGDEELFELVLPFLSDAGLVEPTPDDKQRKVILGAMPLVRERLKFLSDAPAIMAYLFKDPPLAAKEEFVPKKLDVAKAAEILALDATVLADCDIEDIPGSEAKFRSASERSGMKFGDLLMPLRVAVTGAKVSPPLFESIRLLGLPRTLARIEAARAHLAG